MAQKDKLTGLIEKFSRLIALLEDQILEQPELSKITMRQFYYLDIIRSLANPTITEITRQFKITKPTATIAVNKLVEMGYVKKVQSDDDKRIFHLELTAKGNKINSAHDTGHELIVKKITGCLSEEEISQFSQILNHILHSYKTNNSIPIKQS